MMLTLSVMSAYVLRLSASAKMECADASDGACLSRMIIFFEKTLLTANGLCFPGLHIHVLCVEFSSLFARLVGRRRLCTNW